MYSLCLSYLIEISINFVHFHTQKTFLWQTFKLIIAGKAQLKQISALFHWVSQSDMHNTRTMELNGMQLLWCCQYLSFASYDMLWNGSLSSWKYFSVINIISVSFSSHILECFLFMNCHFRGYNTRKTSALLWKKKCCETYRQT